MAAAGKGRLVSSVGVETKVKVIDSEHEKYIHDVDQKFTKIDSTKEGRSSESCQDECVTKIKVIDSGHVDQKFTKIDSMK